jgi:hypothetical protein
MQSYYSYIVYGYNINNFLKLLFFIKNNPTWLNLF